MLISFFSSLFTTAIGFISGVIIVALKVNLAGSSFKISSLINLLGCMFKK